MSLQVWLPLNKNLKNQGLSNVTVTNNGATFNSAGKLGGCYAPNGLTLTNLGNLKVYPMTIAFWCKTTNTGTPSWEQIILIDNTSNSQIHGIYVADAARLKYEYNPSINAYNVNPKEWHHYTFIVDNANSKVYVDGVLNSSSTEAITADIIGRIRIGTTTTIRLNDVRIYDHCLSPMEVKELSKGLVLHYPLNRGGWGQENLITGYDTSFLSYPDGAVTLFVNQMNGGTQEIVSNIGGATKCLHLHSNGSNNRQYGTLDATSGKSYIISCDYYSTSSQASPFRGELNGGNYSWAGSNAAAYTTPKKWVRLSFSYLNITSDAVIYYFMQCSQNTDCYIKNLKIEEGSIATPWCPNSSDTLATTMGLHRTIEYDISGYCNNGSKMTNTITYTSDTAKYQVSTHFNGTYDGILIENLQLSDIINTAITYAFWIKPEGESGARSVYFGSYSGNSWSIEKTAGNVLRLYWNGSPDETCSGATITDGVWQHICITKSGINDVKVYVNGERKWTSTAAHNNLSFPTTYRIGRDVRSNDGTPYKGLMSDFRIYATALSADDVKSLYQNR